MHVVFRNDDVSVEHDAERFKKFCGIFHKYGFVQLHGVTPYGRTSTRKGEGEHGFVYPGRDRIDLLDWRDIVSLSENIGISDNPELVGYLNSIPDPIALHGPYHYDFTQLSAREQEEAIGRGLAALARYFPHKAVADFIPPFNKYNEDTRRACEKYGLRLHEPDGEHLEALIHYKNRWSLADGVTYRYHHHRFYEHSAFSHYNLSLDKLNRFFMHVSPVRPLVPIENYKRCVAESGADAWFGYAYEKFEELKQCYFPYQWIRDNIADRAYSIAETGCGAGGTLHMLWHEGFTSLHGYDADETVLESARRICREAGSSIAVTRRDCTRDEPMEKVDVLLGMNWMYLVPGFSLDTFLGIYRKYINEGGYCIFDVIDSAFNEHPLNRFFTQDWKKPEEERRPSEYLERWSEDMVLALAVKHGLRHVATQAVEYTIPRKVYVLQKA